MAGGGGKGGRGDATCFSQAGKKAGDFVHFRSAPGRCKGPSEAPSAGNLGRLWMIDGAAASQIRLVAGYMAAIDVSTQHEFRKQGSNVDSQTGVNQTQAVSPPYTRTLCRLIPTLGCLRAMQASRSDKRVGAEVWR